ncbi:MAG TPA: hypothetical protein VKA38_03395 [Draconibacterium sp.]|nr:hypothetical protein [Draconibacterium sp.]
MKTRIILFTICLALLSVGASAKIKDGKALTGNSLTDFGKYTIVNSDNPMVADGVVLETYDLTYENTNNPIRIGVLCEKKCTNFIVRSDEFEVQYMCNKGVFGVKKIDKKYQQLPNESNLAKLNKVSYYSQRVICCNPKTQDELLGLIACYFPNLVNEEYQANF